jgi:hypothetical protein
MVTVVRRQLPRRRSGHTVTVTIGAERFCLTANQRDDGSLGEVFIHWGKHGSGAAGLVSAYAGGLSLGLRSTTSPGAWPSTGCPIPTGPGSASTR